MKNYNEITAHHITAATIQIIPTTAATITMSNNNNITAQQQNNNNNALTLLSFAKIGMLFELLRLDEIRI